MTLLTDGSEKNAFFQNIQKIFVFCIFQNDKLKIFAELQLNDYFCYEI
jgi:hypothetical protein